VTPLRILQVSTTETGGGAASVAGCLTRELRARDCVVWEAVGRKTSEDPNVFAIPDDDRDLYRIAGYSAMQRQLARLASRSPGTGWGLLGRSLRLATHPRALVDDWKGLEDFEFPGTYHLLDVLPARPDIAHLHNLHGGYFDLRALPWLSRQVPTLLTLHDGWTLSGHCAHSFECDRWKTGCGQCPDLTIEPAIRRDATAQNWIRKRRIYAKSRLYVATPCRWLLERAEQSMLAFGLTEARVIPNGVDVSVFRPADKHVARAELGIPKDAEVLLVTTGHRGSMWRDHRTLIAASNLVAARAGGRDIRIVVLGADGVALRAAGPRVLDVGYQADPIVVARYFQAADVYLHAARADTFPSVILEALACGTPVVATAVGGIPEQIRSASIEAVRANALPRLEQATGMLVPSGDAETFAEAVLALLNHREARSLIGRNGAHDAHERFDSARQTESYLAWYRTIIDDWHLHAASASKTGWPWIEEARSPSTPTPDDRPWPRISIVMPSLNQGPFIEEAIRSVLLQSYPGLELIVVDGGSTDDSVETIRAYAPWLASWMSEVDDGPADALNKGFTQATGEILGFLNADDFLLPGCLARVADEFLTRPGADVVSGHGFMAKASSELGTRIFSDRWDFTRFVHGACILVQPATFFRRAAFQRVGGFHSESGTAWDAQLWADMALAGATFHAVDEPLAVHRIHAASISGNARLRAQRFNDANALQRMLRGRCEIPRDRLYSLLYRMRKFVGHPGRTLRQRWFFYTTLRRWSL
jgi:glycosyltransferase involved in cell wall biosynthesis